MVQFLVGRNSGLINTGFVLVTVDATIKQESNFKNQITSFPVENGLDISDHVRQEPDILTIEGIVSNNPAGAYGQGETTNLIANYPDAQNNNGTFAKDAFTAMLSIAGRAPIRNLTDYTNQFPVPIMVDIIGTRYSIYVDMICEDFKSITTNDTGDAIHFTATFKKIRKATVNEATINFTTKSIGGLSDTSQSKVDLGKQNPEEVPEQKSQGFLGWLSTHLGNWWNGKK
jgi:hypothetical protein